MILQDAIGNISVRDSHLGFESSVRRNDLIVFLRRSRYAYKKNVKRFAEFARGVFDVTDTDDETAAVKGIEALEGFFKEIGMPLTLREFGIENEAEALAELCTMNRTRTIKSYVEIDAEVAKEIFNSCY